MTYIMIGEVFIGYLFLFWNQALPVFIIDSFD